MPVDDPREPDKDHRKDWRVALLVAALAFLVYNANLRDISSGDTIPARFVPMAVLGFGTVYLTPLVEAARMGHTNSYWILARPGGRWASMYPVVTPLLVTPLYLPAVLHLERTGWTDVARVQRIARVMEKLSASLIAAVTVGLMYLLVRRSQLSPPRSLLLTAAFGLGTETWAISSQALWQHGTAELLLVLGLLACSRPATTRSLLALGVVCGLIVANRPPDALLALGFILYLPFWVGPRRSIVALVGAALPLALVVGYNLFTFGNLGGGYSFVLRKASVLSQFFSYPLLEGVAGQLISPGKGLLIYSPFLLFVPLLLRRSLIPSRRTLSLCLLFGVMLQIFLYAKTDWRGGYSYGPRYLTDLLPILIWLAAPILASLRAAGLWIFAIATLFSVYVQVIGAFVYPNGGSDQVYYPAEDPTDLANLWPPRNAAFILELRFPPRGHFDFLKLDQQK